MIHTEELLTKREVATRLRKSTRWIEGAVKAGYLPAIKLKRSVLFDWEAVLQSLRRFELNPNPPKATEESK